jgi:hypothetical protein
MTRKKESLLGFLGGGWWGGGGEQDTEERKSGSRRNQENTLLTEPNIINKSSKLGIFRSSGRNGVLLKLAAEYSPFLWREETLNKTN